MFALHHTQLCARLKRHLADIGGPTSLARFLAASAPTIDPLLAHGVRWAWIAPRIDAVRADPDGEITPDLPDAGAARVQLMRSTYSRVRKGSIRAARPDLPGKANAPAHTRANAERGHDPPRPAGPRERIRSAADRLSALGKLET